MGDVTAQTWVEKDPKVRQSYGKEIAQEALDLNFFNPLIGLTDRAIIRTQLLQDGEKSGGTVRVYFGDKLTGDGGSGNDDFDDNIDNENIMYMDVDVELHENSLLSKKMKIAKREAIEESRTKFKSKLAEWDATKTDKKIMISYTRDCTNIIACKSDGVYPENKCSSIAPGDNFTTQHIKEAIERAENGVDGDGNLSPKVKPFKVIQKNQYGVNIQLQFYIMIIGPGQKKSLLDDPVWIEAQKHANKRGEDNPIFTGQVGAYEGVIILTRSAFDRRDSGVISSKNKEAKRFIKNLEEYYGGKDGNETEIGLFLGAQSGLMVDEGAFNYYEDGTKDMGRKFQVGVDRDLGFAKAKFKASPNDTKIDKETKEMFDGKDFATIAIVSSKA